LGDLASISGSSNASFQIFLSAVRPLAEFLYVLSDISSVDSNDGILTRCPVVGRRPESVVSRGFLFLDLSGRVKFRANLGDELFTRDLYFRGFSRLRFLSRGLNVGGNTYLESFQVSLEQRLEYST
jgi:hypothetical protein